MKKSKENIKLAENFESIKKRPKKYFISKLILKHKNNVKKA